MSICPGCIRKVGENIHFVKEKSPIILVLHDDWYFESYIKETGKDLNSIYRPNILLNSFLIFFLIILIWTILVVSHRPPKTSEPW